jgi:ATP-binding cassette, subfamily B, bacterial
MNTAPPTPDDSGTVAARAAGGVNRAAGHWPRVWRLVAPQRGRLALLALTSFWAGAVEAAFLVVVTRAGLAIADGGASVDLGLGFSVTISGAIATAAAFVVARLLLALAGISASTLLMVEITSSLRRSLALAYLQASWGTQQAEPAGRLQQLVTSFTQTAAHVVAAFTTGVTASLNLAALIAVVIFMDPASTLVVVTALLGLSAVLAPIRRRIRLRSRAEAATQLRFASSVSEFGALGLEMQAYGVAGRFGQQIGDLIGVNARATRRADLLRNTLAPIYTTLAYSALLVALALALAFGGLDLAGLGVVTLVMLRSLGYGQQLQTASGSLMTGLPFLEELDSTLARFEAERATNGTVTIERVGPVEARHISFAYRSGEPVLRDVSFRIEPGEVVGVIGPSGSGKSTLVQLLLGLRDPDAGAVMAGEVNLRNVDRASWARRVAFVAQDARLFTGTIAENIRFFREGIDDNAIERAAVQANIASDILDMSFGFDSHIGERGTSLSGGQRQRLSIARALAGQPELLVLDEPTSALDARSESLVRDTLETLRGRVTVIIIAHRLSTLENCDRIMVIEDGRLTAIEAPETLRERSAFYRQSLELAAPGGVRD